MHTPGMENPKKWRVWLPFWLRMIRHTWLEAISLLPVECRPVYNHLKFSSCMYVFHIFWIARSFGEVFVTQTLKNKISSTFKFSMCNGFKICFVCIAIYSIFLYWNFSKQQLNSVSWMLVYFDFYLFERLFFIHSVSKFVSRRMRPFKTKDLFALV